MVHLQKFNHPGFGELQVIIQGEKELFPATEMAEMLGYSNPQKAIRDHCRPEGVNELFIPTKGGQQLKKFINEGNLYRLIAKSKMPEAVKFEKWVFDEVLPTIRKHGAYMTQTTIERALTNPDFLIQLATQLKDEQQKRFEAQRIIEQQRPIVDYYQRIINSTDVVATTQIAQDYGLSAYRLNQILHEEGVQYKLGGQWILYGKYQGKGYVRSQTVDIRHTDGRESVKMHTKWTQKGRVLIHRILENRNIYPQADMWKEAQ